MFINMDETMEKLRLKVINSFKKSKKFNLETILSTDDNVFINDYIKDFCSKSKVLQLFDKSFSSDLIVSTSILNTEDEDTKKFIILLDKEDLEIVYEEIIDYWIKEMGIDCFKSDAAKIFLDFVTKKLKVSISDLKLIGVERLMDDSIGYSFSISIDIGKSIYKANVYNKVFDKDKDHVKEICTLFNKCINTINQYCKSSIDSLNKKLNSYSIDDRIKVLPEYYNWKVSRLYYTLPLLRRTLEYIVDYLKRHKDEIKTEEDLNEVFNNLISVTIEYDNNEYRIIIENQNVFITPYHIKEVFLISKDKEMMVIELLPHFIVDK